MKLFMPVVFYHCCFLASSLLFSANAQERSLRFYGNGYNAPGKDRVKIALESGAVNVSDDFTIECWLKCLSSENQGTVSGAEHGDGWITGNIFLDRDIYGNSETGDYGFSIGNSIGIPYDHRVVAFGISRQNSGVTVRGNSNIADNKWHHIAVTRDAASGEVKLYIDGLLDASAKGPIGSIQYPMGRPTFFPKSDPFIVLGSEKHDAGGAFPAFNGSMDELRISTTVRYTGNFTPSSTPFIPDAFTAGLYHFNDSRGSTISDVSANTKGPSNGELYSGGSPAGPVWINESPFQDAPFKWKKVSAKKENQRILISWITTTGIRSFRYEIQRSSDGMNYTTIGQQYSNEECVKDCSYSFADTHPVEGKSFYRIKNTTQAGDIIYSAATAVLFTQKINPYKIWQNGTNLVVQNSSSIESMVIWNSDGKRLLDKKNIQKGTTQVPISHSKGYAFIHINLEDGTRFTEKVLLR